MRTTSLLLPLGLASAAPAWLPAALRECEPVARAGVWDELLAFFRPGGGSESYRVAVDATRAARVRSL